MNENEIDRDLLSALTQWLTAEPAAPATATVPRADPTTVVEQLLTSAGVAGPVSNSGEGESWQEAIAGLRREMEQWSAAGLSGMAGAVVSAVTGSGSTSTNNGEGSVVENIGHVLLSTLTSGLGMVSLAKGLYHLFGGGDDGQELAPIVKYAAPAAVRLEAGFEDDDRTITTVDTNDRGMARPMSSPTSAMQVTVQVNAIDSRSFLDYRNEIAQAVREAMLNSHAINDVVAEL